MASNGLQGLDEMITDDNRFSELVNGHEEYEDTIRVYDVTEAELKVMSDVLTQKIICFSK